MIYHLATVIEEINLVLNALSTHHCNEINANYLSVLLFVWNICFIWNFVLWMFWITFKVYSYNWFDPALAFKDTGTSSNKTKELTKSTNMRIWEMDRLKRPFIRGYYTENKFSKKKKNVVTGKSAFFVIGSFCTPHSICLNVSFWQVKLVSKCCVFNSSTLN